MYQETDLNQFLSQFSGQKVDYIPNNGNIGDLLIYASTLQHFKKNNIEFVFKDGNESDKGDIVFFGGGGNLYDDYDWYLPRLQKVHKNYKKVIILPHTIYGSKVLTVFKELGKNVFIFCREKISYDFLYSSLSIKENIFLAHDVAFSFDYSFYKKQGKGILNAFRRDGEKALDLSPDVNVDLSDEIQVKGKTFDTKFWLLDNWNEYLDSFLNYIANYEVIRTSRLHVAIAATLLEKKVEFYPNSYFKNEAVYNYSLASFENVVFKQFNDAWHESLKIDIASLPDRIPSYAYADKPAVSVIIPVFNDGFFLLEAVESIYINNDHSVSFEILIANDGSTDFSTLEILKVLQSKGYTVLHKKNGGLAETRNFAIKHSKAPIILPLDADNKIDYNYLVQGIKHFSDEDIAVVYSDVTLFGETNQNKKVSDFNLPELLAGNFIDACALIRKEAWEKAGGYDEGYLNRIGYEDWELWINIAGLGYKFHHINEFLFYYRVRKNSMVAKCNEPETRYQLVKYVIEKHAPLYNNHIKEIFPYLHKHMAGLGQVIYRYEDIIKGLNEAVSELRDMVEKADERMNHELLLKDNHIKNIESLVHLKDNHISNLESKISRSRISARLKKVLRKIKRIFYPG